MTTPRPRPDAPRDCLTGPTHLLAIHPPCGKTYADTPCDPDHAAFGDMLALLTARLLARRNLETKTRRESGNSRERDWSGHGTGSAGPGGPTKADRERLRGWRGGHL